VVLQGTSVTPVWCADRRHGGRDAPWSDPQWAEVSVRFPSLRDADKAIAATALERVTPDRNPSHALMGVPAPPLGTIRRAPVLSIAGENSGLEEQQSIRPRFA
jgi:hypothetical protein